MWQVESNLSEGVVFEQHKDSAGREAAAQACSIGLKLDVPTLLDEMDDGVERAYAALPDRLYLIDRDGSVAFRGDAGPVGFDPAKLEEAIVAQLAKQG